ncbi:MAG: PatB family C-S lyase [Clostridia bacterium]|jgi:cystathionine beta-lyase|nr:PatB family C-S lyase [Clostridia bacterium]HQE67470.1 PatB family C-S lyase [Bacillota bacterium]HRU41521.1 PatB family C-S lyase [Candidatus Diapherotrites archaeon]
MKYDFDRIIARNGTNAIKWDSLDKTFGATDILPMWVADMDFEAPRPVIDAIVKRAQHGIYGYTSKPESFYYSISSWMEKRHGWHINNEWIEVSAGVVPAISLSVLSYSEPGDKILLQSPVYFPFFSAIESNNRVIVNNQLKYENHQYTIDFEDLEQKLKSGVKVFILCNPHNPVGRVWSREELEKIGELCVRYNVVIVSDEIHSDLVFGRHIHIPIASISEELAALTVTCMAPSKTFNIAGLYTSAVIISDKALRDKFKKTIHRLEAEAKNLFGIIAFEAAYTHGEEWLEQALPYLEGNLEFLVDYFIAKIPKIKVSKPQGTYLAWLDCRELGMNQKDLVDFFIHKAKVGLNDGAVFGAGGEGFMRLNAACPRSLLEEGLKRIENAVNML